MMIDTGDPEIRFCRSGFRKWDHSKTHIWGKWPSHDTLALYRTCRQINLDMREDFHPGPLALKIMDDMFFDLCAGDKLYSAIEGRSWLTFNLEIIRLEITALDSFSENQPVSHHWKAHHENEPILEAARTAVERVRGEQLCKSQPGQQAVLSQRDANNLRRLSQLLKNLPRLKKIELLIRSSEDFWMWADPFGYFQALQDVGAKFSIIVDTKLSLKNLWALITKHGGELHLTSLVDRSRQRIWSPNQIDRLSERKREAIYLVSGDKTVSVVVPVFLQEERTGIYFVRESRGFAAARHNFLKSYT
jgi:hypothetical protein